MKLLHKTRPAEYVNFNKYTKGKIACLRFVCEHHFKFQIYHEFSDESIKKRLNVLIQLQHLFNKLSDAQLIVPNNRLADESPLFIDWAIRQFESAHLPRITLQITFNDF